jgi:hypothetical protein
LFTAKATGSSDTVARVREAGDNEEQRDEVFAVNITPDHSERPGHEVSERGPERNEVE